MLGYFRPNKEYQTFVLSTLKDLAKTNPEELLKHRDAVSKMLQLNLDPAYEIIAALYSFTGRAAQWQADILRSFILMIHCGIPLNNWIQTLQTDVVLRTIAGFTKENMPKTSSYYDFINRIVPMDEHSKVKPLKSKPKQKLKKGEKLPPKNTGVVAKLVNKIICKSDKFQKQLGRRPERFLQKIFAEVSVKESIASGLVEDEVSVSGDGTCIETAASSYGVTICKCREQGIYNCTCDRKFSDPNATWGWDSHKARYFYGYTGYFISTYSKSIKTDLPLYLRLVEASRHDSVSAVFALAEFKQLYPDLPIHAFISDSASDNYATYELLNHYDINAVIALNPKNKDGNRKYAPALEVDKNGVPICQGGHKMIHNGFCGKSRCRIKWRCPRVLGKVEHSQACDACSKSAYGRVIYTKPSWDLRLFTKIPRGSLAWKSLMKERTAAERVNNRILNDYGIENSKVRGKKRTSFFVTIAAMNIHLDAQIKLIATQNKPDTIDLILAL